MIPKDSLYMRFVPLTVLAAALARLRAAEKDVKPESMLEADRLFGRLAVDMAGENYDLILLYLRGADFAVEVLTDGARKPLKIAGVPFRGAIQSIDRLSGTHGRKTPGIFIAAGPEIDPTVEPEGLRVIDVSPTVLYAIGLPAADDFAGKARTELFSKAFRDAHALQTIPTWGAPTDGENLASEVDEELVDQLRALGYID